jgi:SAM-dependent MidA family methyltransferase
MPFSALHQLISERIQREGPLSFAEYMRLALYEPGYGYYVTGSAKMGWQGDYFTSTDVSSLFANCMGRQLYSMWEKLKHPAHFLVLEQGAGRGDLAGGVRMWAQEEAPAFHAALDYQIEDIHAGQDALGIERTAAGRPEAGGPWAGGPWAGRPEAERTVAGQPEEAGRPKAERTVAGQPEAGRPQGSPLPWTDEPITGNTDVHSPAGGTQSSFPSVILSNELIDAFPVHIVEKRGGRLYEVFVDVQQDGRLCEVLGEPGTPAVAGYLDSFNIPWRTFEEGWRAEINLDALRWIQRTASLLRHGFTLTIDYGDRARALYSAARNRGTLLCYFQHQLSERPLARPGEQDITAHVNFSALIDEGRRLGLRLHKFTTQRLWLQSLGIQEELEQRRVKEFAAAETERATDRGQVALLKWRDLRLRVAALTDPAGMGNFKVLILRR